MFWFIFIFALLAYGMCHITYVYRKRAIESGESKIGLFESSICPACRNCKKFIFVSFAITVFTALIVSYPKGELRDWSFLSINQSSWELIHIIIGILFAISVIVYFYIHAEELASGFKKLFRIQNL